VIDQTKPEDEPIANMTPRRFHHLVKLTEECVKHVVEDQQFQLGMEDVRFIATLFLAAAEMATSKESIAAAVPEAADSITNE
jgi:hypothetical protein